MKTIDECKANITKYVNKYKCVIPIKHNNNFESHIREISDRIDKQEITGNTNLIVGASKYAFFPTIKRIKRVRQ